MKLRFKTVNGASIVLQKVDDDGSNPIMTIEGTIEDVPCEWGSMIQNKQIHHGVYASGEFTIQGKKVTQLLAKPKITDAKAVEDFFLEQREARQQKRKREEENKAHQHKVFVDSYAGMDFVVYAYIDDRWSQEEIIAEISERMAKAMDFGSPAFSSEYIQKRAPEVLGEWIADRQAIIEAKAAKEAKHEAIINKVTKIEVGRPYKEHDDYSCKVTVVALDGKTYQGTFLNVFDAGLVSPHDWSEEILAAAIESLPEVMRELHI